MVQKKDSERILRMSLKLSLKSSLSYPCFNSKFTIRNLKLFFSLTYCCHSHLIQSFMFQDQQYERGEHHAAICIHGTGRMQDRRRI